MSSPSVFDSCAAGLTAAPISELRYVPRQEGSPVEAHDIVLRLIPPDSRVLDVGCGLGGLLRRIGEQPGCRAVGLEPHPGRAAAARAAGLDVLTEELSDELRPSLGL